MGHYFEVIIETMTHTTKVHGEGYIFSMLYESRASLGRRIEFMEKYIAIKKTGKLVTALLVAVFVMTSVTTAYAAGCEAADVQEIIYKETEQTSSINDIMMEEGMTFIPAGTDGGYDDLVYANPEAELIMPVLGEEELASFEWEVPVDTRYVSGQIYLQEGQKVAVSCAALPSGCTYWIGIMNSFGDVWYYEGDGALGCNFYVNKKGNYRVLVQNRSDVPIVATGNYYYYTP